MSSIRYIPFNAKNAFFSILNEKSIVIIGPNFYTDKEGNTHQKQIIDILKADKKIKKINYKRYYEEDGFFLFKEDHDSMAVYQTIARFYKDLEPNDLLCKIVEIPFHVYLTVTPDTLLCSAFEKLEYNSPQAAYYTTEKILQKIEAPTKNKPLIYNAFGIWNKQESMILTHDDLYKYFKNIFSEATGLPDTITSTLDKVQNIFFLGVPFQKWYMHLLVRTLGAQENKKIMRFAAEQSMSSKTRVFCTEQFKITFIDKNIIQFVNELHQEFKQKNKLRDNVIKQKKVQVEKIRNFIKDNNWRKIFETLKNATKGTELDDDVVTLEGRYENCEDTWRRGLQTQAQKDVQINIIRERLMKLTKKLEQL